MKIALFLAVRYSLIMSGIMGILVIPSIINFFKGIASDSEKGSLGLYFILIMVTLMIGAVRKFEYGKFYAV